ncbi:BA14K family protein [Bradyrhizobium sp.]|uniref:BA14K family protein n=1 Tax=Bradyrhizobium sp. TaxID=376 RepID=UPI003C39F900
MPPPGGCTPIGLTVSGEIVFPFACKGFIERQKAMAPPSAAAQEQRQAAQDQPTAVDGKPAVADDNPATAPDKPAAMPEQPAAALDKPAGVEDKPAAQEEKPAATAEQPVVPDQKPAATAEKSAVPDEKPAATQTGSAAPELSRPEAIRPGETIPLPRRAEQKRTQLAMDPMCKHFRSYNPGAGTYKGFDGRMRPCK